MDINEIADKLLEFLDENGLYHQFLDWAEERGFDTDDLNSIVEKAIGV